jgi:beta-lactamase superfamily II metal-dependent hydrolase
LLSLGAAASRLAAKTVALQGADQRAVDGSCDLGTDQVSRIESSAKPADVVRWDVGDHRDLVKPGRDGDPGRETGSQRAGDFIVTPVLERENRLPKNTVVFAPQNRG